MVSFYTGACVYAFTANLVGAGKKVFKRDLPEALTAARCRLAEAMQGKNYTLRYPDHYTKIYHSWPNF